MERHKFCAFLIGKIATAIFLLLCYGYVNAAEAPDPDADRGIAVVEDLQADQLPQDIGDFHAVIIGIDEYQYWPNLRYAEGDAFDIARILRENYGYRPENIVQLYGGAATRDNILEAIDDKMSTLAATDHLLVFYAGHGQLDDITETGYWIPQEGNLTRNSTWIRFSTIIDYLRADNVPARSIVVITDSCYGGALSSVRAGIDPDQRDPNQDYQRYLDALAAKLGDRSRQVLASGGFEEVPDRSRFADALKTSLSSNPLPMVELSFLFWSEIFPALKLSGEQDPVMVHLADGPGRRGPFVLVRKQRAAGGGDAEVVPTVATLTVRSNVVGDTVWLDDAEIGTTRLDVDLLPGPHIVRVEKSGYEYYETIFTAAPGEYVEIDAVLQQHVIPDPEVTSFEASALAVRPGEAVRLTWRTANAARAAISGIGDVPVTGAITVKPLETTTYRLDLANADDAQVSADVVVKVDALAPRVVEFRASPDVLKQGQRAELAWLTADATDVTLAVRGVAGAPRSVDPKGTMVVRPRDTTTYVLRAVNAEGVEATSVVELQVQGAPRVVTFAAGRASIRAGTKTRLGWKTENADRVVLEGVGVVDSDGTREVAPTETTEYRLTAYSGQEKHTATTKITVTSPWLATDLSRAVASVSAVRLRPQELASGDVAIRQTYTLDLDTGRSGAGKNSDLWFNARTATDRYLTANNGAGLTYLGAKAPAHADCKTMQNTARSVNLANVKRGDFLCVKTNRGNISRIEITRAATPSPGVLNIRYVTWQ